MYAPRQSRDHRLSERVATLADRGLEVGGALALDRNLEIDRSALAPWRLTALAGRFVEITRDVAAPSAALTATASLFLEAQAKGELVAWISAVPSIFYPPDLAACGVDLAALPIVRVSDVIAAARAADELLRSGAFAVVLLDLGERAHLPVAAQTRLTGLAKRHHSLLLVHTETSGTASSLGSLVSLRVEGSTRRVGFDRFVWQLHAIKDKTRGPGWRHAEVCRGPDGLC